jgi:hypothetical protein
MAFRRLRQQRYNTYINSFFLPFEAYEFSGIRYAEAPYMRKMIRDRINLRRTFDKEADFNNWTRTRRDKEWRAVIKFEYTDHRWIREKQEWRVGRTQYKASPWEMLKDYRQKAIDSGDYHPVKGRRIRRTEDKVYIHIYKGDVEGQKRRARARIQAIKGTPEYEKYRRQRAEQKKRAKERERAKEH